MDAQDATIKTATGAVKVNLALTAVVSVRDYWQLSYLSTARAFADAAQRREDEIMAKSVATLDPVHRAYVTAAVFHAVGYLEAIVNSVLEDILNEDGTYARPPAIAASALKDLAANGPVGSPQARQLERQRLDEKIQMLTEITPSGKFDKGSEPFQSTTLLVEVRNVLTHFHPETVQVESRHDLEKKLRNKFEPNPQVIAPWMPNKLLGSGLAQWACDTVETFSQQFFVRLGLVVPTIGRFSLDAPVS